MILLSEFSLNKPFAVLFVKKGGGGIGRAVIHADALPVREGLRMDGAETLAEILLHVMDRHDDGNGGHLSR